MYSKIISILIAFLLLISLGALINTGFAAGSVTSSDSLGSLPQLASNPRASDTLINVKISLKASTPLSVVESIYNQFKSIKVNILNSNFPSVYSRIVKDLNGDYVFKVIGYPKDILHLLGRYKSYIHSLHYKPVINFLNALEERRPNPVVEGGVKRKLTPKPNTFVVDDLIGAYDVWSYYGYTGAGINIAIVDTGVDYGHPDLQSKLTYFNGFYNGTHIREPLILDADESQVLILKSYQYPEVGTYITTNNENFTVFTPFEVEVPAPHPTYYVGNVTTASGTLKFGVTYMYLPAYGLMTVGVLMSDPVTPGNYTQLIIDANNNGIFNESVDAYASYNGNRILAAYSAPAWPYISYGVAGGFFFDVGWWFNVTSMFYPGWSLKGDYISIFYDFHGHGTACASAAAGSGYGGIPGVAPDANIVGVKALWFGDVEPGWLWAAGFDVDPVHGYEFIYTGSVRAQILSNSWGISDFTYDIAGFGYDYISILADALMTPQYYDYSYPGVLIVMAAGNGGGGYGTVTSAGASSIALTVGASTSTHPYAFYYGFGGYTQDEIIGWSARGPVPTGEVKPDVVNVGAFGITAAPVGIDYEIFGGTSYATPLTAGAAALLYQAIISNVPSWNMNPLEVKSILMMSADPLKYSPFDQGAGRVNVFRAVNMSMGIIYEVGFSDEIMIWNEEHYANVKDKLSPLWFWMMEDYIPYQLIYWYNDYIFPVSPYLPSYTLGPHYSIYVNDIPQGGSKNFTISLANLASVSSSIEVTPVKLRIFKSRTMNLRISVSESDTLGRYKYIVLSKNDIPESTELMMVSSYIPYNIFDGDDDYNSDWETYVIAYVWLNDSNNNGIPDTNERAIVNYDESNSTMNRLMIKNPRHLLDMYGPDAKLLFRIWIWRSSDTTPAKTSLHSQKVGVRFDYMKYVQDKNVKIMGVGKYTTVLSPGDYIKLRGKISVKNVAPTVYQGFLRVRAHIGSIYREYYVPYSYTVYTTISRGRKIINNYPGGNKLLYSWDRLRGDTDWWWRYESGDWRVFYVDVENPSTWLLEVDATWKDKYTSLITYTLGPDGQFAGMSSISYHEYLGGGVFLWTNTGYGPRVVNRDTKTFPTTTYRVFNYPYYTKPALGIYTIIVRNILYGGRFYPEKFQVFVKAINNPNMLPSSVQPASGTLSIAFKPPYSASRVYAYATQYIPPFYSSQFYTPYNYLNITPPMYTTHMPIYHFTLGWGNLSGLPTRIDIAVYFYVEMPSISVYYRYGGSYYLLTDYYYFEDYITTFSPSYFVVPL